MKRDDLDELMLIYAAGVAEDDERETAESLLGRGDIGAQSAYAEAQAVMAAMALSLRRVEAPRNVRDKLLFRVTADLQQPASPTAHSRPLIQRRITWPAYVATGIAAALAIALTLTISENRRIANSWAQSARNVEVTRTVMGSPRLSLAKLSTDEKQGAFGRVLYCPIRRQYQVAVYHLSPPKDGRVFELWFITPDQKKVPAGTFTVDGAGDGMISVKAPDDLEIALAAITDEPVGGSLQPTGSIHLAGQIQPQ